jgi:beta-lactamase class A
MCGGSEPGQAPQAAYYVKLLPDGPLLARDAGAPFPAASIIKLIVLWEFYRQAAAGALEPDELAEAPADCIVGGSGVVQHLAPGGRLRLGDLATLMIIVSDNTATNLLIDRLGREQINAAAAALGLGQTRLLRKLFDAEMIAQGVQNWVSAADTGRLLELMLAPGDLLPDWAAGRMVAALRGQQHRKKLPAWLPADAEVANKTGEIPGCEHDAGIIWRDGRAAVAVALTQGLADREHGIAFCRRIGLAAYDRLAP